MDSRTNHSRREFLALGAVAGASALLAGCSEEKKTVEAGKDENGDLIDYSSLTINDAAWSYDADNDVYYQIGLPYCLTPQATDYESFAIYVPGAYMTATDNGDDTFTCAVNPDGAAGSYTATTAPIVMPINTAGYSAQAAATEYSYNGLSDYLDAGLVYVYAGCRGRDNVTDSNDKVIAAGGAPWGVTDLKACVRTLRYNAAHIPGSTDRIFSFGHSGGGAQSAVLGVSGDADGYTTYLQELGAPTMDTDGNLVGDGIHGSMCWCPITCLDMADAAYEWQMGQFVSTGTRAEGTFTQELGLNLAATYASYINGLGLYDEDGNALTLETSGDETLPDDADYISTAGTYYDYIRKVIEGSLNTFLANTEFPYTPSTSTMGDMGAAGGGPSGDVPTDAASGETPADASGDLPDGEAPSGEAPIDLPDGEAPSGEAPTDLPDGEAPSGDAPADISDGEAPADASGDLPSDAAEGDTASAEATTYETVADYIASLNANEEWVTYDEATNTASISGISAFARQVKTPTKDVGAFDSLDLSQAENSLFGNRDQNYRHFDATMVELLDQDQNIYEKLTGWDETYPESYRADYEDVTDDLGTSSQGRQNLYNPLYYLCDSYDGKGEGTPASHWRIRTGITQGDTSLCTEVNLARALATLLGEDVCDFATVWGLGHTTAEVTGDSTTNFIQWVADCCAADGSSD